MTERELIDYLTKSIIKGVYLATKCPEGWGFCFDDDELDCETCWNNWIDKQLKG